MESSKRDRCTELLKVSVVTVSWRFKRFSFSFGHWRDVSVKRRLTFSGATRDAAPLRARASDVTVTSEDPLIGGFATRG